MIEFYVLAPPESKTMVSREENKPSGVVCTSAYRLLIGDSQSLWHCQGLVVPKGGWEAGKSSAGQAAALASFIESLHRFG